MTQEDRSGAPKSATTRLLRPLDQVDPDTTNLITEFFFVFSRFEYALKRAGYVRPVRPQRRGAEPDWDAFAESIAQRYAPNETEELATAIHWLLSEPPKRQIVGDDGSLTWDNPEPQDKADILSLLKLVKRVRNNLFHGGKYPYTPVPEPARDPDLLKSSLIILEACLGWNEKVRRYFMSDLDV